MASSVADVISFIANQNKNVQRLFFTKTIPTGASPFLFAYVDIELNSAGSNNPNSRFSVTNSNLQCDHFHRSNAECTFVAIKYDGGARIALLVVDNANTSLNLVVAQESPPTSMSVMRMQELPHQGLQNLLRGALHVSGQQCPNVVNNYNVYKHDITVGRDHFNDSYATIMWAAYCIATNYRNIMGANDALKRGNKQIDRSILQTQQGVADKTQFWKNVMYQ